jgi:hypothetical protein
VLLRIAAQPLKTVVAGKKNYAAASHIFLDGVHVLILLFGMLRARPTDHRIKPPPVK